jgi:predicted DNA primase small subunit
MTAEIGASTEVVPSSRTHLDKENVQNMQQDNVLTTPRDNNDAVEKMTPVVSPSTTTTVPKSNAPTVPFTPELLKMYYSRLFPFSMLHSWLSYDPLGKYPQLFSRREFSFTIEPTPGDEIYCRYESFSTAQELKQAVLKRRPHKIDLGAIFSHPPKDHNAVTNFAPVQRELVFDIDLTDYDEVRHCGCTGAAICPKCWTFMNMAVKVMDQGLRDDFGFTKIAWFYSGRRGVHAWVCDESARLLSNEARSAVANYFEVRKKRRTLNKAAVTTNGKLNHASFPCYVRLYLLVS